MGFLTIIGVILSILLLVLTTVYVYYLRQFQYWKRRNVKFIKPTFPGGNMGTAQVTETMGEVFLKLYNETKHEKFVGTWMMFKPSLMVNDPDLIKNIVIKDFNHFQDRGVYVDPESDPLSDHLVSKTGSNWRNMRVKLTPAFTSGKMKNMFQLLAKCNDDLVEYLKVKADNREVLEMKDLLARAATDVIAICAFGLEVNSVRNPDCVFRKMGKKLTDFTLLQSLGFFCSFLVPDLAAFLKIRFTPKPVEDFFMKTVRQTMDYRRDNKVKRNDFIDMMMELMNKGYLDDVDAVKSGAQENQVAGQQKFTFSEAAAHAGLFYLGGFETSSTTLQFAFYELALHPNLQEKLRQEIDGNVRKYDGKLTYEGIHEMELMDGVVSETLRKYSPGSIMTRLCTKDYIIPGTDVKIDAGMLVSIPVHGIHNDARYYPEPHVFDPYRFTKEEKAKRHNMVYLPFGEGPRNCIGNRFGLMQTKSGLAWMLLHYKFEVCEETPIPVTFEPKSMVFTAKGGMRLRISHRDK